MEVKQACAAGRLSSKAQFSSEKKPRVYFPGKDEKKCGIMAAPDAIEAPATIIERIDGKAYRAKLPNGKIVVAHFQSSRGETVPSLEPGSTVRLELSPFDFSRGKISTVFAEIGESSA